MSDALIKACDLYTNTSRGPGNREYWAGYLGGLHVVIFRVHNPEPGGPTHTMFLAERKPRAERRDPPTRGNPWAGCTLVSPGCTHCYAMRDAWRISNHPTAAP